MHQEYFMDRVVFKNKDGMRNSSTWFAYDKNLLKYIYKYIYKENYDSFPKLMHYHVLAAVETIWKVQCKPEL